jgi:hypothetical protein
MVTPDIAGGLAPRSSGLAGVIDGLCNTSFAYTTTPCEVKRYVGRANQGTAGAAARIARGRREKEPARPWSRPRILPRFQNFIRIRGNFIYIRGTNL